MLSGDCPRTKLINSFSFIVLTISIYSIRKLSNCCASLFDGTRALNAASSVLNLFPNSDVNFQSYSLTHLFVRSTCCITRIMIMFPFDWVKNIESFEKFGFGEAFLQFCRDIQSKACKILPQSQIGSFPCDFMFLPRQCKLESTCQ